MDRLNGTQFDVSRIAYDQRKGRVLWPDGARMAVLIYTCPEEWDWSRHEPLQVAGTVSGHGEMRPTLSVQSAVQYGFNVGLRRIRDAVIDHEIPFTVAATGNAAERHPESLAELASHGFHIAAHGWSEGTPPVGLNRAEQSDDIDRTVQAIKMATGVAPVGWWSPAAACDNNTVELLAEKGFLFHGDLQDDELPYIIRWGEHEMVEIPYNMVNNVNDYFVFVPQRQSVAEQLAYYTSTFDAYYEQAARTPLHMIIGTHPFVTGRPEAAYVFTKLLEHMRRREDVWFATYDEVATWWLSQHGTKSSEPHDGRGSEPVASYPSPGRRS